MSSVAYTPRPSTVYASTPTSGHKGQGNSDAESLSWTKQFHSPVSRIDHPAAESGPIKKFPRISSEGQSNNRDISTSNKLGQSSDPVQCESIPIATDLEYLEHAVRRVEATMQNELNQPSYFQKLVAQSGSSHPNSNLRMVSGMMEYDYPPLMEKGLISSKLFSIAHKAPLPQELIELLNGLNAGPRRMGLFPEIFRAWMTIDNELYLWDFRDGGDLCYYDSLNEPILTLSLVNTKPKIFQSRIKYLLCIATASQIVILGLMISNSDMPTEPTEPVLTLVQEPIFSVSSDLLTFTIITGTKSGRIFMGSLDGSIHEIGYQSTRGWFSGRVWKTNLTKSVFGTLLNYISSSSPDPIVQIVSDDIRNILYARTAGGTIHAYDLGTDGKGFWKIGSMSFEDISSSVVSISKKALDQTYVKKILDISAIDYGEINLVATLETGARLYFTCYHISPAGFRNCHGRPVTLQLIHMRLPPGYCSSTDVKRPANATKAFCANGITSFSCPYPQDKDNFWLIVPLLYPTYAYSEVFCIHQLPGRAIDVKSVPIEGVDQRMLALPEIAYQHLPWIKQIVVLTQNGTVTFQALKPYEQLKEYLLERTAGDLIKNHFALGVSPTMALSNSLLLATHPVNNLNLTNNVTEKATQAFFSYGQDYGVQTRQDGTPLQRTAVGGHNDSLDFNPNVVSTPQQEGNSRVRSRDGSFQDARGLYSPLVAGNRSGLNNRYFSGNNASTQRSVQGAQFVSYSPPQCPEIYFSSRHDAIYLQVSRILQPIWNKPLVKFEPTTYSQSPKIMSPNISEEEVACAISFLQSISQFLENSPEISVYSQRVAKSTLTKNNLHEQDFEKISIVALTKLIGLTLEVLGMWKIICSHQLHIILSGVTEQMENATIKDLIISNQGIVAKLLQALISKYVGDNAAVDAISLRLREACPTLFRTEDAIGSKIAELMSKARHMKDKKQRFELLKEAQTLCEKICRHGRASIQNYCEQLAEMGYPLGAVKLCLAAAEYVDKNTALAVLKSPSQYSDQAAIQSYHNLNEIYKVVFDILDRYISVSKSSQTPLREKEHSRVSDDFWPKYSPEEAHSLAEETINCVLNCDEEFFHIGLYDWLLERKLFDRLLHIRHPYLDAFLQRAADVVVNGKWINSNTVSSDTRMLDLLWRHHEMNQNHSAAAQILSKLADSTTTGLNLQQRIEYLSRAIICAKSCYRRGNMLQTLEDKLEVSQIQKQILDLIHDQLQSLKNNDERELKSLQDAEIKLNSQLFSIAVAYMTYLTYGDVIVHFLMQLYLDFANVFKLNEAILAIYYCAGNGDRPMIEGLWSDIIEAELTSSGHHNLETQMKIINRKLVSLGQKYVNSPTFFPIEFLVEHLEMMKPTDTDNVGWVFKTMLEIGVPFASLLNVYDSLWKKFTSKQATTGGDVELAKVIMLMIDEFTEKENMASRQSLVPELREKCEVIISSMVVEFSSRFDSSSKLMTEQLNRVKGKLNKGL